MPFDSNGNYTLPTSYFVENGDTVLPIQHNPPFEDVAQALSSTLLRSGVSPMTGDLKMGGRKITGMADGAALTDAVTKQQVDTAFSGVNGTLTYITERFSQKSANYTAVKADNATSFQFTAAATLALTVAATLGANWWCEVWATNGNVTIDPNGSQTIDGKLTTIVQTGQMAKVFCNGSAFFTEITGDPLSGPHLQGYSFGLDLINTPADLNNDITVGVGSAAADTSPYALMQLTAARIKRIDAAWAVGTNVGGLDTGAVSANATYYLWLIQRSDTLVTDVLYSLSSTAPTMPANYDRKRLIGSLVRTGSANGVPRSRLTTPPPVESAQLTPVLGGLLTFAHGYGFKPGFYRAYIVCTTAEGNWSVGDETCEFTNVGGGTANGVQVWADNTNVYGRVGNTRFAILMDKSTGAQFIPTIGNWRVILRASP